VVKIDIVDYGNKLIRLAEEYWYVLIIITIVLFVVVLIQ